MGLSNNGFLSFGVVFHFHDDGRRVSIGFHQLEINNLKHKDLYITLPLNLPRKKNTTML